MRTEHAPRRLFRQELVWQPEIAGLKHDVPITVVHHPDALLPSTTQLHFYGGLGEERILTGRGVKALGKRNLPAVGIVLPFHHLEATAANIERTLVEVPIFLAQTLNEHAGNPADKQTDLFGKSQGGGAVLLAATHEPAQYGAIAALSPVGFNADSFGETPKEKRREFLWRLMVKNNLRRENRHVLAAYEVGRRAVSDIIHGSDGHVLHQPSRFANKLDYALAIAMTDLPDDFIQLAELAKTHPVAIFGGEADPLFRDHEYRTTLEDANLERLFHVVPGSHTNLATEAGAQQLGNVAVWIHGVRAERAN